MARISIKQQTKHLLLAFLLAASNLAVLPLRSASAIVPGDNGRIVYTQQDGNDYNIYTANPDGSNPTALTNGGTNLYPAWSPDGTKIAYGYRGQIVTMNADGSDKAVVPMPGMAFANDVTWSPDGAQIAFLGRATNGNDVNDTQVFTIHLDGTGLTKITDFQQPGPSGPRWSPDGNQIIFSYFLSGGQPGAGSADIYAVNTDGTGLTNLTNDIPNLTYARNQFPEWSPDGSKIGYTHNGWIWTMNADGSDKTELTFGPEQPNNTFDAEFSWSPDGTKIVFGANFVPYGFVRNLYVMNADGTGTTQIATNAYYPDWQPIHIVHDNTPPSIVPGINPAPLPNGWNNTAVSLAWGVTDPESPVTNQQGCDPATLNSESTGTTYTCTATSSGGTASQSVTLKTDWTTPVMGIPVWSVNPKATSQTTTLTVPATDNLSGIQKAEYFIGDNDPGQGNGATMTLANVQNNGLGADLTTSFGTDFQPGVYKVNVRAMDNAGNWSPANPTFLVVYDPASPLSMTGRNKKDLIPSLAAGDILPGLTANSQTDPADFGFTVQYKNGTIDPHSDFQFSYNTGTHCNKPDAQNCHSFSLNATSIAWLLINGTNNSNGHFQGTAILTVDGATTTNPFTIQTVDGDLLTPASNDYLILKVYAPGADPATAHAIYQASGYMAKGNSVTIR